MSRIGIHHRSLAWLGVAVLVACCWWSNKSTSEAEAPAPCPCAYLPPPPAAPDWVVPGPPAQTTLATPRSAPINRCLVVASPTPGTQKTIWLQDLSARQNCANPQISPLPPFGTPNTVAGTPAVQISGLAVRQVSDFVVAQRGEPYSQLPPANAFGLPSTGQAPAVELVPPPHPRRLEVPKELPGANGPEIQLPPLDREHAQERAAAVANLFPPLPPLGTEFQATAIPQGNPLSLYDLEQTARQYSPQIRQAEADVRSAEGNAVQAGLYPNPTLGYESDDVNQGLTVGQQGGFVDQTIKTGGKLHLAKAAAEVEVSNAQVALRKAQSDLASKVRGAYFATLVAQENVRISHALARFSDEAYNVQVDMVKGGQAAAYEPLQLRVLANQARASLVLARNRYISAWKQLASVMGLPGMPPAPLAGSVDMPVPIVRYDAALAHILAANSDVITAENSLRQSQINLRLAQVNRIPDVDAHVVVQKDYTTPPFGTIVGVSIGGPLPLWDHNQGNIMAAEAAVMKASEGPHFARDDLTSRLADAYERYQDNIKVIELYRRWMLPDQVQAYRGAYQRHQTEPDVVAFADVVTAQQTLATTITAYVTQLGTLWQAVVDMGSLLEVEDLYRMGDPQCVPPVPDLTTLCPLPCCHWSQPAAAAGWLGGDPQWQGAK